MDGIIFTRIFPDIQADGNNMKAPKVFNCRTDESDQGTPVKVIVTKYTNPETLAILLRCAESPWEDFAVITVNLVNSPYGDVKYQDESHAYINTNSCPWAEDFLQENGIAKPDPRDIYGMSGYCTYPLYEFAPGYRLISLNKSSK